MGGGAAIGGTSPSASGAIFSRANLRPAALCTIAVLGAFLYGYDGTYYTSLLAQTKYNEDFGDTINPTTGMRELSGSRRSLLTSLVQAGEVVGCLMAGFVGNKFGRKGVFATAAGCVALGALLQIVTTGSVAAFAIGRVILGVGVGNTANSTPMYLSEVAPTSIRGIAVSCWQLLLAIGQVVGAGVGQGVKDLTTTAAYRIPIGLNFAIVLAIFVGLIFLPESPRWLIEKGREEQALRSLRRINASAREPEIIVQQEFKLFKQVSEDEKALGEGSWMQLFRSKVERRKLSVAVGILVAQQISGVQFIFSYATNFLGSVGVGDPFIVTLIVTLVEVLGVLISFTLINRFGRRELLLSTSVPMIISLLVVGGLGTVRERSETENRTIAAMVCIYVLFFNLAFGPLAWAVASEVSTGQNKGRIMSLATSCFFITAFVVVFTQPYLYDANYANLGAMIGFIYSGGAALGAAFVYFCVPETLHRSLEEISEMMEAHVPTRKWRQYVTGIQAGEGGMRVRREMMEQQEAAEYGKGGAKAAPSDDEVHSDTIERVSTAGSSVAGDETKGLDAKKGGLSSTNAGTKADVRDA